MIVCVCVCVRNTESQANRAKRNQLNAFSKEKGKEVEIRGGAVLSLTLCYCAVASVGHSTKRQIHTLSLSVLIYSQGSSLDLSLCRADQSTEAAWN